MLGSAPYLIHSSNGEGALAGTCKSDSTGKKDAPCTIRALNAIFKKMLSIERVKFPIAGLELLAQEARAEGHFYIDPLFKEDWVRRWFSGPGEGFYVARRQDRENEIIAISGLNKGHSPERPNSGVLSRVYVRPAWRRQGVARALVDGILSEAFRYFHQVELQTQSAYAARLYESMGFIPVKAPDVTHVLSF